MVIQDSAEEVDKLAEKTENLTGVLVFELLKEISSAVWVGVGPCHPTNYLALWLGADQGSNTD